MKKVVVSIIATLLMFVSLSAPLQASAEENTVINEKENLIQSNSNAVISGENNRPMLKSGSGWSGKYLNIRHYTQETNYWCGPAALKSALTCFGNYSYSQSTLANWMGTNSYDGTSGYKIKDQLNNLVASGWYTITYPSMSYRDTGDLWTKMTSNIQKRSYPVVCGVYGKFPGFSYDVRHFITVYGYEGTSADQMTYMYVDPAGGRLHNIKWGSMKAKDLAYYIADGSIIW